MTDTTLIAKRIILGTVQLGLPYGINNQTGKPSAQEADAILRTAQARGIEMLDTADGYGTSQAVIGQFQQGKEKFRVFSKFTFSPGEQSIFDHLHNTLAELETNQIECYSFHRFRDFADYRNQNELRKIKPRKTRLIGASVYSNEELAQAIDSDIIDVIQLPLNLLDHAGTKAGLLAKAKARQKTLHVRSVYLQGLFFKAPGDFPTKLRPLVPHIDKLKLIADRSNLTLGELALLYSLSIPEIDAVLMGVETERQLLDGLNILAKGTLPQNVVEEIEKIQVEETALLSPANW